MVGNHLQLHYGGTGKGQGTRSGLLLFFQRILIFIHHLVIQYPLLRSKGDHESVLHFVWKVVDDGLVTLEAPEDKWSHDFLKVFHLVFSCGIHKGSKVLLISQKAGRKEVEYGPEVQE